MSGQFDEVLSYFEREERSYSHFSSRITALLSENPELHVNGLQIVHSVKSRKKSRSSILSKCTRKLEKGVSVNPSNAASEIEDFFGIRVLHLHFDQVSILHNYICKKEGAGEFVFGEKPVAYTWDPESNSVLNKLGFDVRFKESYYTSLHYILRVGNESDIRCELQVRTLFEEAWGELDHWMNYPNPTELGAVREQLLVLSRVVAASSRLAMSISRMYEDSIKSDPNPTN